MIARSIPLLSLILALFLASCRNPSPTDVNTGSGTTAPTATATPTQRPTETAVPTPTDGPVPTTADAVAEQPTAQTVPTVPTDWTQVATVDGDLYVLGNPDAPIRFVDYSDFL